MTVKIIGIANTMLQTKHSIQLIRKILAYILLWATVLSPLASESAEPVDETKIIASDLEPAPETALTPQPTAPKVPTVQRLREQEVRLLSAITTGPSSLRLQEGEQAFLAFWQADLSGEPAGAVLLLHDRGRSPRWPATMLNMLQYLPIHGWATLSFELLNLPEQPIPERQAPPRPLAAPAEQLNGNADESQKDPAKPDESNKAEEAQTNPAKVDETQVVFDDKNSDSAPAPEEKSATKRPAETTQRIMERNQVRILAAIAQLHKEGQYNIVIVGAGFGAYQALAFLGSANLDLPQVKSQDDNKKAMIDRAIRALVLLDADNQYPGVDKTTLELINLPDIPTLDLSTDMSLNARDKAQKRKRSAQKNQYENYILRRITPARGMLYESEETQVTKTIRGFLERYAKGVKL